MSLSFIIYLKLFKNIFFKKIWLKKAYYLDLFFTIDNILLFKSPKILLK